MRILLVHNRYQQRGGEDAVAQFESEMLRGGGNTVVEFIRTNDDISAQGRWNWVTLPLKTVWAWDSEQQVRAIIEQERPDVAHFHNTFPLISPAAYYACHRMGVPVVQTLHNYRLLCPAATLFRNGRVCEECLDGSLLRSVVHGCYRGSRAATAATVAMLTAHRTANTWSTGVDAYIALTRFARDKFVAAGLPADRIHVKPNFLRTDPGVFNGSRDYAFFAGRLSPEKGVFTLLEAWKQLSTPIPLLIAGDGPLRPELHAFIERSGLADVHLLGSLPREETIAKLQRARFLVFPSEWYEGFPMTVLESLACGTPVIYSGLGGMNEIIENGSTGIRFEAGSPSDLAHTVQRAWSDPLRMASMGAAARCEFEQKYTAKTNYSLLLAIYAQASGAETRHCQCA